VVLDRIVPRQFPCLFARTLHGRRRAPGIRYPSFDAVDLPRFNPISFPPDAIRIVKDPLLQERARWYSRVSAGFPAPHARRRPSLAPGAEFHVSAGCDILRYNYLFNQGVEVEDRFAAVDMVGTEESWWRPGVIENAPVGTLVVMDERSPTTSRQAETLYASIDRLAVAEDLLAFGKRRATTGSGAR